MNAADDIARMQAQIAALQANQAALLLVVSTLMQTHHDGNAMHLLLTAQLEQQLGNGAIGKALGEAQREQVREFIERLGSLRVRG